MKHHRGVNTDGEQNDNNPPASKKTKAGLLSIRTKQTRLTILNKKQKRQQDNAHIAQAVGALATLNQKINIFTANGSKWLKSSHIDSCLTLLLHTQYRYASHQPTIGPAHEICSVGTLKNILRTASQKHLEPDTDFPKVLVGSLSTNGPCPSIVVGDGQHFKVICINAKTKTVDLIDPLGHDFRTDIKDQICSHYGEQAAVDK